MIQAMAVSTCWHAPAVAACLALVTASGLAAEEPSRLSNPNLAVNGGFEEAGKDASMPANWSGDPAVYARDDSTARTGKASLRYSNDAPTRYVLCGQKVAAQPGRKYRFSVWVKTKDLAGKESGATVCMEWQDKAGKWMGGTYPDGVKGTRDWTRVEAVVRVPAEAGGCTLTCYVRKGMTGTAWFDDVELVRATDPAMRTVVTSPLYRGRITAAGPKDVRFRVRLNLADHDLKPADVTVLALITAPAMSRTFGHATAQPDGAGPCDLTIPVGDLPVGKYSLSVQLIGRDGKALEAVRHDLERMADDFKPKAYIDEHRRLILDGKPFFPIGMYWSSIEETDIKLYADSSFNCLMPYGSPTKTQMDLAHHQGLKVIYSVKDYYAGATHCSKSIKTEADEEPKVREAVRQFRDHPALLAWYLNDELPQPYMPRLEAHQRWVEEDDPHHPTWAVLFQVREIGDYLRTFDVIGSDPYPIGRHPASMAAEWTIETFRQVECSRPMWQVPQAHNWGNYDEEDKKKGRTPSYAEKRSMAWQCICEGATGLVFYSWFDMKRNPDVPFETQWQDLKKVAAEIAQAAPALLSVEPVPSVKAECQPDKPRWLHSLARSSGGKLRLFAVNDGDAEGQVTFAIGRKIKSVTVPAENRTIQPDGESFRDEFKKLDVRVYEVE
ncbi:MAG: hypothetical protein NTW87_28055 [Planctomycetota bacterium]|nr:hypothetical protein [Planctomycetota bacterium]